MFGVNLVILAQICDSYRADKVKFTYGQTDKRTDAGNNNTPSAWKFNGVKSQSSVVDRNRKPQMS